jgi:hypothetical protein
LWHWIWNPWAKVGALWAAYKTLPLASVYSNWIVLILPK